MYPQIPESLEVRRFAETQVQRTEFVKTWHGTAREALQLRRAIHRQVCQLLLESEDFHAACRPASTPLFNQHELDRLVFVKRIAERYAAEEFTA